VRPLLEINLRTRSADTGTTVLDGGTGFLKVGYAAQVRVARPLSAFANTAQS
jgi:hypothetical protein